jgi:cell division protein FtsN
MEAIMQRVMKICARGALGLGAAALLLSGVPAHANPAAGAASRESQPRLLAQSTAQPGEAEQLEKRRQEEQRKKVYEQQQQQQKAQQQRPSEKAKMRGPKPGAPGPMPEAAPSQPGSKRFGAGVIRKSEKPVDEE